MKYMADPSFDPDLHQPKAICISQVHQWEAAEFSA